MGYTARMPSIDRSTAPSDAAQPGLAEAALDRAALVARLNARPSGAGAAPTPTLRYLGSFLFGDRVVARYTMHNGLKLLLLRDDAAKVVSFHTWFCVG
jgi:hypothetical protein